jgi:4-carboxymuconolactone decarboxylase
MLLHVLLTAALATTPMHATVVPERLPPIPAEQMTDVQRQVADELTNGPRGGVKGPFVPLLRSPELLSPLQRAGEYLRFRSSVPPKLNELAILVTSRSWAQDFEWETHAPLATKAGVQRAVIDAIRDGRRPERLARDEAAVYAFVTELLATRSVSDETYDAAVAVLGERGIVDLTAVTGYYALVSMVLNVARTPPPSASGGPTVRSMR